MLASPPVECENCGELCADGAKPDPWAGMMLCAECAYDEGIAAEDRWLERHDEADQQASDPNE